MFKVIYCQLQQEVILSRCV